MNVSLQLPRFLTLLLGFLLLPGLSEAQFYAFEEMAKNDTLEYSFVATGFATLLSDGPYHGSATIGNRSGSDYFITYVPNPGYTGRDTLKYRYGLPPSGFPITKTLEIEILNAKVTAIRDFTEILSDSTATIDILANDQGNMPVYFSNISLVTDGTATYDTANQQLVYTPELGFSGTVHINYTACVDSTTCDAGIATIFVIEPASLLDTTYIASKRGQAKMALLPLSNGYQLETAPSKGTVTEVNDGEIKYTPRSNVFADRDTFTYIYNVNSSYPSRMTFVVYVLDTEIETLSEIAFPDFGFVTKNGSVNIDVLVNDNTIFAPRLDQIVELPTNGTATIVGGEINYVPNLDYRGVDRFTYKACATNQPGTACEFAEVIVTVDDLLPSATTFELTTIKNTPLVVKYGVPLTDFDFGNVPEESLQFGDVEYYETFDGDLHGQYVSGDNLIFYYPPVDYVGGDRFEFDYCPGTSPCQRVKVDIDVIDLGSPTDTFCVNECVWAGDANADGTVNINDLLPVGYSAGSIGPSRNGANINWYGQFGDQWNQTVTQSETDLKHVDTDGDGVISTNDTLAITESYGLTSNITPGPGPIATNIPLFFVQRNPGPYLPGDLVEIDIILGNEVAPAVDISGLTFSTAYNSAIVEPGTYKVEFDKNSWLTYNTPTLDLNKLPFPGFSEAGISRASGISASGFGKIGKVSFIVVDELLDGQLNPDGTTRIDLGSPTVMNGSGIYQSLPVFELDIQIANDENPRNIDRADLLVFPNPADNVLNLHVNGKNEIREYFVYNLAGQQMDASGRINVQQAQIDISDLQNGLYLVQALTDRGVITKKFEVLRKF